MFLQTPMPSNVPIWMWFVIAIITIGVPLIMNWINNVQSKRTTGDTEIRKAEIEAKKAQKDVELKNLNEALHNAIERLKELDTLFKEERAMRVEAEELNGHLANRITVLKVSFRMVLTAYTAYFKDDPEQLALLQEFESVLGEGDNKSD